MEAILKRYDDERRQSTAKATAKAATTMTSKNKTERNNNKNNDADISVALKQLIRALRDVLTSLEGNDGETKTSDEYDNNNNTNDNNNGIDAKWLIQLLRPVATDEEHLSLMVRLVWEAVSYTHLTLPTIAKV